MRTWSLRTLRSVLLLALATFHVLAAEADGRRSAPLDLSVRSLERMAIRLDRSQTRDRHCLAPQGLPPVLDMESWLWPTQSTNRLQRGARPDSQNESREFALGII